MRGVKSALSLHPPNRICLYAQVPYTRLRLLLERLGGAGRGISVPLLSADSSGTFAFVPFVGEADLWALFRQTR